MKAVQKSQPVGSITRILKKAQCPSMSNKSQLKYQIGVDAKNVLSVRIVASSGGGYFSSEWIAIDDALKVMAAWSKDRSLTSWALQPLFIGKSINTPAFLMAALLKEGLVARCEENPRVQVVVDPKKFKADMKKLVDSDVNLMKAGDKFSSLSSSRSQNKSAKSA